MNAIQTKLEEINDKYDWGGAGDWKTGILRDISEAYQELIESHNASQEVWCAVLTDIADFFDDNLIDASTVAGVFPYDAFPILSTACSQKDEKVALAALSILENHYPLFDSPAKIFSLSIEFDIFKLLVHPSAVVINKTLDFILKDCEGDMDNSPLYESVSMAYNLPCVPDDLQDRMEDMLII